MAAPSLNFSASKAQLKFPRELNVLSSTAKHSSGPPPPPADSAVAAAAVVAAVANPVSRRRTHFFWFAEDLAAPNLLAHKQLDPNNQFEAKCFGSRKAENFHNRKSIQTAQLRYPTCRAEC